MTRIIALASGKGGVGKSNIGLNLALLLGDLGLRTCLFDADLGLANIDVLLGIYPETTLEQVVFDNYPLNKIIVRTPDGLDLIPGASGLESMANLAGPGLETAVGNLSNLDDYDFILVDCSSGIARQQVSFCLAASEVILVATPEPTSLVDAFGLLKVLLTNDPQRPVRVIINNCRDKKAARSAFGRLRRTAAKHLKMDLRPVGLVLKDRLLEEAVRNQRPLVRLFPQSLAARCLGLTAQKLAAETSDSTGRESLREFWEKYFDLLHQPLRLPAGREKPIHSAGPASAEPGQRAQARELFPHGLPILPQTLQAAIGALKNDPKPLERMVDIAGRDPGFSLNLIARAAAYGFSCRDRGPDLKKAVRALGLDGLRSLVEFLAVLHILNAFPDRTLDELWDFDRACQKCAQSAQNLAPDMGLDGSEAYWAGLWHDTGRLCELGGLSTTETSRAAGAGFLEGLGLSSLFADVVRYCRQPAERVGQALPLVRVVHQALDLQRPQTGLNPDSEAPPDRPDWAGARVELSREVRSLVVETASLQPLIETSEFSAAAQGLGPALFEKPGPCPMMLFDYEPRDNRLTAVSLGDEWTGKLAGQLRISTDGEENSLVRCLKTGRPLLTFGRGLGPVPLVEAQLGRLLQTEALYCHPLKRSDRTLGVMVIGCDRAAATRLTGRAPSIQRFVNRSIDYLTRLKPEQGLPEA